MDDDPLSADAPAPRLCHITKWKHFDGYGFNLHAEKATPGQFVGHVDPGSPAEAAGLRVGDRIVEVNGVNIGHENHRQVVARIKAEPEETRLLVMDAKTERYYRKSDIVVRGTMKNVVYLSSADSPRFSPKHISNKREVFHEIPSSQGEVDEDDDKASVASAGSLLPTSHTQKVGLSFYGLSASFNRHIVLRARLSNSDSIVFHCGGN
jgi:membrane-associated protease RseP (regulator of RpoE activity)